MDNKLFDTYTDILQDASSVFFETIERLRSISIVQIGFSPFEAIKYLDGFQSERKQDAGDYLFQLHMYLEDKDEVDEPAIIACDFLPVMKAKFENRPLNTDRIPDYLKGHRIFGFEGSWKEAEEILKEVDELVKKSKQSVSEE